jgi:peptidoglycan/LPS O-acetylase OafA/YrhL
VAVADVDTPTRAQPDPAPAPAPKPSAPHLPYFAGLDGVRGLAVAGVLLFHAGFPWMIGGYLGVSTFFTLSGFLITSLLLAERASNGRIELKAFWLRRFRRLMPAALACLVLALLFGVFIADAIQREDLAGDVIASLAYVANWHFIFSGQSYNDLFAAGESPVLHFWSLAIEEQFYVLYPLLIALLVGIGAWGRRSSNDRRRFWFRQAGKHYRHLVGATLLVLVGVSLAITLFAGFSDNRIYLGTDTRASELLVGGLLAVLLFNAKVTGRLARRGVVQLVAVILGLFALIAAIVLWSRTPQDAQWLYHGGFTVYAIVSATFITAAILPVGPVAWVLSLAPLRHIGRISYGLYLYHWPVFLALRQKARLDEWSLLLVGLPITFALAELSYRYLEMPIRRGQPIWRLRSIRVAPVAAVGIAIVAILLTVTAPSPDFDFDDTRDQLTALAAEAAALPPTTVDPAALVPPAQPRLAAFGDSTALQTSWGLANYIRDSDQGVYVDGFSGLGCSVIRTDQRRTPGVGVEDSDVTCNNWANVWKQKLDAGRPDIALVQVGPWEIVDRQLPGDDEWRGPGDPEFDDYLFSEMTEAVDVLSAGGRIVVWLTSPLPGSASGTKDPSWDPDRRMTRFNELVQKLPQARPGKVVVVDLAGWVDTLTPAEDTRMRPDGVHFSTPPKPDTSTEAANEFLGAAVLDAWKTQWTANKEAELSAGPPTPLLVLGDETAGRIGDGLAAWSAGGRRFDVYDGSLPRCGITEGGARLDVDRRGPLPTECNGGEGRYLTALFNSSAQTAVMHTALWDVTDRQLADDPTWRAPGDPLYDAYLLDQMGKVTDFLHDNGVQHVVWLLTPHLDVDRVPGQPSKQLAASDPTRVDRLNDLVREMASTRPYVRVLDYALHARQWPDGEFDGGYRPDGVNPNDRAAESIAAWLGPQLVDITSQAPQQQAAAAPTQD